MNAYENLQPARQPNHEPEYAEVPFVRSLINFLKHHGISLAVLLVLICLSYPGWFSSLGLSFDDLTRLNAPQRIFVGSMLRHGQLPLWNPYNFGGQPFLAAGQSGPLYLPNLLFAFLPISLALKLSYALHVTIASWSMYFIGYRLTQRRLAAIASGIVFVTSGFMLGHQIHTQMFDAISLVPLAMYFLIRLLDKPNWTNRVLLGVAVALEVYAGHPQVSFYLFIVLFLSTVIVIFLTLAKGIWRRFAAVLTSGVLALLLSAPQWLPTVLLIPYSDRAQASDGFLLKASLPVSGLLQFLSPFTAGGGYTGTTLARTFHAFYGTALFWELTCYAGLTALILAMTAIVMRVIREPIVVALTVQGIVGILLALGEYGPLKWVLLHVPGFDMFRIPARYTVLTQLAIAVLVAVGVAVLMEAVENRKKAPPVVLTIVASATIVVLLWARIMGPLQMEPRMALIVPIVLAGVLLTLTWILWAIHPRRSWITGTVFTFLVCLDMVLQAAGWSSFAMGSTSGYTHETKAAQFVSAQQKNSHPMEKVVALPDTSLAFDKSSAFGIKTLNGYDSLEPAWYAKEVGLTWSATGVLSQPRSMMDALGVRYLLTRSAVHPLWATHSEGITSVLRSARVPASANALLVQIGTINAPEQTLYGPLLSVTLTSGDNHLTELLTGMDNQRFLIPLPKNWPRKQSTEVMLQNETWDEQIQVVKASWMVSKERQTPLVSNVWVSPQPWTEVYSDGQETVWENQSSDFSGAFVTENPDDPVTDKTGTVKALSFHPNQQSWQVTSSKASNLVLGQTFDPGWRATVDGQPVSIEQVGSLYGGLLTGIPVPAGKHTVRLTYHPLGFRTGILMFLTGVLLLIVGTILHRLKTKKQRQ